MEKNEIKDIQGLLEKYSDDPIGLLKELDGFYECPKNKDGKRLGPLVGYAGKYPDQAGIQKQWVGDIYCNFSVAEQYPRVIQHFANKLYKKVYPKLLHYHDPVGKLVIVGPQMGGVAIGLFLAIECVARFAYVEKKITQLAHEGAREESSLEFIRHTVNEGDQVIVCEDVSNNFSTTGKVIDLITRQGATPIGLVTLLNRSPFIEKEFMHGEYTIPVISLVRLPYSEYKQDDTFVIDDITAGNVVWKPKNDWDTLKQAILETPIV